MAHDRFDTRRGPRNDEGRWPDERHDEGRHRGGRDERGFLERAEEKISSWFGDDDHRGRHERDHGRGDHREMGRERGWFEGRDRDDDRNRFRGRDEGDRGGWLGSESYRGVSGESGYSGGSSSWLGGNRGDMDRDDRSYRPMTGDYGRSERFDRGGGRSSWDRDDYRRTSFAGSRDRSQHHDPHYSQWRERQLQELDRDYDEYHRERQSKFENDFGSWRQTRQQKRQMLGQVREHMDVVGNDGEHVGTVDRTAGDRIILTRSDPESSGAHHSISCGNVDRIEDNRIVLDCTAEQAKSRWRDEDRGRALFEREDQGEMGPGMLDRSFSGTYR